MMKSKSDSQLVELRKCLDQQSLPRHVAIIMDGNGRWAQKRGLPRALGHRAGMESLREIVSVSKELGINALTVYALSTENWKRPREEISILMSLLCEYVERELVDLHKQDVQIRAIGHLQDLPSMARQALLRAERMTEHNQSLIFNIALNYGGRTEIVEAARELAQLTKEGVLQPEQINETLFQQHLYTRGLPDPDLLIRTAGEFRISNFLLWQTAYTEFVGTTVYWPDFREAEYLTALVEFQHRKRRFGGL